MGGASAVAVDDDDDDDDDDVDDDDDDDEFLVKKPNKSKSKTSNSKKLSFEAATANRGVVYINRPTPYMRPDKVRHLLQQYADVTRIFLQPEDETVRKRRRKEGGNRKMRYKEGWVEFASKRDVR